MHHVWKTYYGFNGIRIAWFLSVTALPVLALWYILTTMWGHSDFGFFIWMALFGATCTMIWRSSGLRVETYPYGIRVVNMFKTHSVSWNEISGVMMLHKYIAVKDKNGMYDPPPERWGEMIKNNETLTLFDMVRGPQELTSIELVFRNGQPNLKVDAISRNVLSALTDGANAYHKQTGHYTNIDDIPYE